MNWTAPSTVELGELIDLLRAKKVARFAFGGVSLEFDEAAFEPELPPLEKPATVTEGETPRPTDDPDLYLAVR